MLLHPHFFFCAADERPAAAKRQSAFTSERLAAYAAALALLLRHRRAPYRRQACALAFASLRLRLDCFYTFTFTPGLRLFLTASVPARHWKCCDIGCDVVFCLPAGHDVQRWRVQTVSRRPVLPSAPGRPVPAVSCLHVEQPGIWRVQAVSRVF